MNFLSFIRKILILGLIGALPTSSFAIEVADLNRTWVSSGGAIDQQAADQIIRIFEDDAETNELIRDVAGKLGASNPAQIMQIVGLCDEEDESEGQFVRRIQTNWRALPTDDTEGEWDKETQEQLARAIETVYSRDESAEYALSLQSVSICVQPNRPLLDTFLTFVHELAHFRGFDLLSDKVDVLDFPDEQSFVEYELYRPGGEYDAHVAEMKAHKRLKKRSKVTKRYQLERYFDAEGHVINRTGLANYILDGRDYRTSFRNRFAKTVVSQYNNAANLHNWYVNHAQRLKFDKIRITRTLAEFGGDVNDPNFEKTKMVLERIEKRLVVLERQKLAQKLRMSAIDEKFGQYFAK